jgi:hypothetical protein
MPLAEDDGDPPVRTPYHLCVVAKRLGGQGFVVTCYVTDAIKEGTTIWPTSG